MLRFLVLAAAVVALAHLLDPWAQVRIVHRDIYGSDLGRLLRVMGFYPLWALMAVALFLVDHPRHLPWWSGLSEWGRRGLLLFLTPATGGLVAEVGKLLFRRLRPGEIPGEYAFRSFAERPFYSGGLGLPSSHTLVAFAALAMLARLFPRAAPVWYALAVGCAFSRVAAGAHYLSDVTVAAGLGWLTAWAMWHWNFGKGADASLAVEGGRFRITAHFPPPVPTLVLDREAQEALRRSTGTPGPPPSQGG